MHHPHRAPSTRRTADLVHRVCCTGCPTPSLAALAAQEEAAKLETGETTMAAPPSEPSRGHRRLAAARSWLAGYARKFRGVPKAKAPPIKGFRSLVAWRAVAWTWLGVALTLMVRSRPPADPTAHPLLRR